VQRTPDWGDFVRGVLGASAGAVCVHAWRRRRNGLRLLAASVLVAALLAWPVLDAGPWLLDAYEGYRDFPVIASFQTSGIASAEAAALATPLPVLTAEETAKVRANLAKLSPEDRALAEAQVLCAIDQESAAGRERALRARSRFTITGISAITPKVASEASRRGVAIMPMLN